VPGYFKAMKEVCDRHGALLIFDEVMSGMGRCGTLHAWQHEGIVPDLETIGKGLGGGYAPVAALLINSRVVDVLDKGTGSFMHGQTYQGHPVSCAVALEVQREIRENKLVENVREMGEILSSRLIKNLADHPNVGNIRGRGLFWGVCSVHHTPMHSGDKLTRGRLNLYRTNRRRSRLIRRLELPWVYTKEVTQGMFIPQHPD
jgi:adenosylmethionine-8-amino-7-oxononanoate aminotransferase